MDPVASRIPKGRNFSAPPLHTDRIGQSRGEALPSGQKALRGQGCGGDAADAQYEPGGHTTGHTDPGQGGLKHGPEGDGAVGRQVNPSPQAMAQRTLTGQ